MCENYHIYIDISMLILLYFFFLIMNLHGNAFANILVHPNLKPNAHLGLSDNSAKTKRTPQKHPPSYDFANKNTIWMNNIRMK